MRTPLRTERLVALELRGGKGSLRPMRLRSGKRAASRLDMSREGLGELLDELAEALTHPEDAA
jgi:hypothetical protein